MSKFYFEPYSSFQLESSKLIVCKCFSLNFKRVDLYFHSEFKEQKHVFKHFLNIIFEGIEQWKFLLGEKCNLVVQSYVKIWFEKKW